MKCAEIENLTAICTAKAKGVNCASLQILSTALSRSQHDPRSEVNSDVGIGEARFLSQLGEFAVPPGAFNGKQGIRSKRGRMILQTDQYCQKKIQT